jgi:hypothetical protein
MSMICRRLCLMLVLAGAAVIVTELEGLSEESMSSRSTGSVVSTTTTGTVLSKPTNSISIKNKMISRPSSGVTGTLTSSMTSSVISKGTITQIALSPHAELLAKALKFDRKVLLIVKEETQESMHRLIGYDENDYQIIAPGITVSVLNNKTDHLLASLRKRLLPLGYMAFVVDKNVGLKIDTIGVIKSSDEYDILKIMHTDSDEDDVTNQEIIDRLKEWENISVFELVGAGSDWLEIEFKVLPPNLKSFAEEVNDFCPDAGAQGTVKDLVKQIKKTKRLLLQWN